MEKKTKFITIQYLYRDKDENEDWHGWETENPDWSWYPVLADLKLSISIEGILEAVQDHFPAEKVIAQIEAVEDLSVPALEAKRRAYKIMYLAADTDRFKHMEANTSCFWLPYKVAEYIWDIIQSNAAVDIRQATEPIPIATDIEQQDNIPDTREWSKPMSKTRLMGILKIDSIEKFNSYAERLGLKTINRKSHQLCMDTMTPKEKDALDRG